MPPPYESTLGLLAELDSRAERTIRLGVLLPWANVAVEGELPRLGLAHTVFHYARLVPRSRTTAVDASFWHGLREASVTAMDSLAHVPLDTTILACTSAGFTGGPPLPPETITAFDTLLGSLGFLNAARVVLATPYPESVTRSEVNALRTAGVAVLAHMSLGLDDGYADVRPADVRTLLYRLSPETLRTADAVVLSCTGWHTLSCIRTLEEELGRPVVSSNLAVALHAARLSAGVIA
ncbi:hypothetical protein ACFWY6_12395 [Streptomyces sp. NPDC059037]|uniref:aspartate racemase/maleate isomerase family protein n=1 Tax=Streptomyces sp. NPDC059037 TaxID=3346710 RepID=UPI0036D204EB